MELYKKYPKLTVLWCCVEIILYPGQLFGWSSLQYVLKQEGFYSDLCELENKKKNLLRTEDITGRNTVTSSNRSLALSYSEVCYIWVFRNSVPLLPIDIDCDIKIKVITR